MENTSPINPTVTNTPSTPSMGTPPSTTLPNAQTPAAPAPAAQAPVQPVAPAADGAVTDDPLLTDKVMPEDLDARWRNWKCLQCNYVYEGQKPLNSCPRCGNADPDRFTDTN
ncbi:MAG: hypothetical protein QY318_00245 [Candidatus Dojkabacteria bacterium]|nr:MAG: hypothetical protein QY318_00245 [Candidatus Dojkabacteria bacterium]